MPTIERRCQYQNIQDFHPGISVISNKGDEIVITPDGIEILNRIFQTSYLNPQLLEDICVECRLCSPTITEKQDTVRIQRNGYEPVSLLECCVMKPYGAREQTGVRHPRVAVVDDFMPESLARWLANEGYPSVACKVNPDIRPYEHEVQMLIEMIQEQKPKIVIIDKGLGYFDTRKIIPALRENGIIVILFSGETDENSEVAVLADAFVMKMRSDEIISVIQRFPV